MSVGKRFEYELLKSLRAKHPSAFSERQPDRLYRSGASQPSPPDILFNGSHASYLIECKVVKGMSLPLDRLSPHQHDYLMRYDNISSKHHGFVAVLYYNGQRGKGRVHNAWLVPISYWSEYQSNHPRKSVSIKHLEGELPKHRCLWVAGAWELPDWV